MTDNAIREPFCPLYREAVAASPWRLADSAHAGLLFDKFADAWRYRRDQRDRLVEPLEPEFDKDVGHRRQGANDWINRFRRRIGDRSMLGEVCSRQRRLVERAGGRIVELVNVSRLVTGMGRVHPLENGFAWHPTLGVPYLPGSSLKGMLRAWLRERDGTLTKKDGEEVWKEPDEVRRWFGTPAEIGQLILFDMLPVERPQLTTEVMTPHYGPYYQEGEMPGDWHSPVPICFLVVEECARWQLGIVPAAGNRALRETEFRTLTEALLEAIELSGAGAKTAVGCGRFVLAEKAPRAGRSGAGGQAARESKPEPPKPRYQRGEKVTVARIEDSAKGKPRFKADDGFVGHFAGEDPPAVAQGETVDVWIANVSRQGYTFTVREPKRRGKRRRR